MPKYLRTEPFLPELFLRLLQVEIGRDRNQDAQVGAQVNTLHTLEVPYLTYFSAQALMRT